MNLVGTDSPRTFPRLNTLAHQERVFQKSALSYYTVELPAVALAFLASFLASGNPMTALVLARMCGMARLCEWLVHSLVPLDSAAVWKPNVGTESPEQLSLAAAATGTPSPETH